MKNAMVIKGGKRLFGEVQVGGAKNSILPILAASVISGKKSLIYNCPKISDVYASFDILKELGCTVEEKNNCCLIDSENVCCDRIKESLMLKMRSSVIFTGAVLARCKNAVISMPGGCELGPRPIDLHLKAFKELGVRIEESGGYIFCDGKNLHSGKIYLDFPSVGATENIMLLASGICGTTDIYNSAREPEIVDLQGFLNSMGVAVTGAGTDHIAVTGTDKFNNLEHTVIGDRIVAATYLTAAAVTGGKVKLTGISPDSLLPVLSVFKQSGAEIKTGADYICADIKDKLKSVCCVSTMPHPGFPTDAQALISALLSVARGTSIIEENIFSGRFKHVPELLRMGADITVKDKIAVIRGVEHLTGAEVTARDLRGAAALITAGLNAVGTTVVTGLKHLDRGYENLEYNLKLLGADIKRE